MINANFNVGNLLSQNVLKQIDKNGNGVFEQNEILQFLFEISSRNNSNNSLNESNPSNTQNPYQINTNANTQSIFKQNKDTKSDSYISGRTPNVPYNGESYSQWTELMQSHHAKDPGFSDINKRQPWVQEELSMSQTEAALREGTARMEQIIKQGSSTPVLNSALTAQGYNSGGNNYQIKTNILGDQVKKQGETLLSGLDAETLNNPLVVAARLEYENKVKIFDETMKKHEEEQNNFETIRQESLANDQWEVRHQEQCLAADAARDAADAATLALKESSQAAIDLENAINQVNNAKTPEEKDTAQANINIFQNDVNEKETKEQEAQASLNDAQQDQNKAEVEK